MFTPILNEITEILHDGDLSHYWYDNDCFVIELNHDEINLDRLKRLESLGFCNIDVMRESNGLSLWCYPRVLFNIKLSAEVKK